jgi:hypothetical protein
MKLDCVKLKSVIVINFDIALLAIFIDDFFQ